MKISGIDIIGAEGSNFIYVPSNGTPIKNGNALSAAYTQAISMSPNGSAKSLYNRVIIVCAPGIYEFATTFSFATSFVDITSLTGESDVYLQLRSSSISPNATSFVFSVDADNINVTGINTSNKIYYATGKSGTQYVGGVIRIGGSYPNNVYKNCVSGDSGNFNAIGFYSIGALAGTYYDCICIGIGFNGASGNTGTFYRCIATSSGWATAITGALYFCRSASTPTVSGSGKVIYHIGLSDQPVNLGFTVQSKL